MDDLIQQGINAYKAGETIKARKLLSDAVNRYPDDERAWGYLFNVCTNDKDRGYCLKQMIRINPNNIKARNSLKLMEIQAIPDSPQGTLGKKPGADPFAGSEEHSIPETPPERIGRAHV